MTSAPRTADRSESRDSGRTSETTAAEVEPALENSLGGRRLRTPGRPQGRQKDPESSAPKRFLERSSEHGPFRAGREGNFPVVCEARSGGPHPDTPRNGRHRKVAPRTRKDGRSATPILTAHGHRATGERGTRQVSDGPTRARSDRRPAGVTAASGRNATRDGTGNARTTHEPDRFGEQGRAGRTSDHRETGGRTRQSPPSDRRRKPTPEPEQSGPGEGGTTGGERRGSDARRLPDEIRTFEGRARGSFRTRPEVDRPTPKGDERSTDGRPGTNLVNPRPGASCNTLEADRGANRRGGTHHEDGRSREGGTDLPKPSRAPFARQPDAVRTRTGCETEVRKDDPARKRFGGNRTRSETPGRGAQRKDGRTKRGRKAELAVELDRKGEPSGGERPSGELRPECRG